MAFAGEGWRRNFGWFFLLLMLAVILSSVVLVWWRRGRFPLKSSGRSALLNTISACASLCLLWYPLEEIRGVSTDSAPCTAFFFLITLFAPVFALPLLAGYLRYFREWKIHAKMQELLTQQSMPGGDVTGSDRKQWLKGAKRGAFGAGGTDVVKRLRMQTSLRTALFQIALGLLPCMAASLALYATHGSSEVVDVPDDGVGVTCLLKAGTRAYEACAIFGCCAAIVAMHISTRRQVKDDLYGIRREFKVMVAGVGFWLGAWGICWLMYPRGAPGFQPGYLQCMAVMHVLSTLMVWPSLRTFHRKLTRPRAGERELQMPRGMVRKYTEARGLTISGGGAATFVAHEESNGASPTVSLTAAEGAAAGGAVDGGTSRLRWTELSPAEIGAVEVTEETPPDGAPVTEDEGAAGATTADGASAAAEQSEPTETAPGADKPLVGARLAALKGQNGSHHAPSASLSDLQVSQTLSADTAEDDGGAQKADTVHGSERTTLVSVLVEPRSNDCATLACLLRDPSGYAAFVQQLEREFSLENMLFWKACEALQEDDFDGCSAETIPTEVARHVAETYCDEGAPLQVNISGKQVSRSGAPCGNSRWLLHCCCSTWQTVPRTHN